MVGNFKVSQRDGSRKEQFHSHNLPVPPPAFSFPFLPPIGSRLGRKLKRLEAELGKRV